MSTPGGIFTIVVEYRPTFTPPSPYDAATATAETRTRERRELPQLAAGEKNPVINDQALFGLLTFYHILLLVTSPALLSLFPFSCACLRTGEHPVINESCLGFCWSRQWPFCLSFSCVLARGRVRPSSLYSSSRSVSSGMRLSTHLPFTLVTRQRRGYR